MTRWGEVGAALTAEQETILSNLTGNTTTGTHTHANDTTEQTAIDLTITSRRKIHNIYLDLSALTQNCTIRVKVAIDGTTLRTVDTVTWTTADDDGVIIAPFTTDVDVRVTIQSAALEGAQRNIPYRIIWEQME